jgi:transposase
MEDVLEVYQRPYDPRYPVVCVDETGKELRTTPRGEFALQPGLTRCQDYEYGRHGTCNLFLAFEPLLGFRAVQVTDGHTKLDFADFLCHLTDDLYPDAQKLVLVTDNLNIHSFACLYERFAPAKARRIASKIEWHFTPEHGSWLNVAECEFSVLKRQCLNRRLPDSSTVAREVAAWVARRNRTALPVIWRFTTADARIKLKHLYPVVNVH